MLAKSFQEQLYQRFVYKRRKESINQNFNFLELKTTINNKKEYASVAYIDIYGFSQRIKNYSTEEVSTYLHNYYSYVLPIIKKYNGQIDKIMGDGIIIIFSKIFDEIKSDVDADTKCLYCCKECIERLSNSNYAVKASIGSGELYFCKTGVEQIYEEYTCIGHPLTVAYRLENIADKNQILLMGDTDLSMFIEVTPTILDNWKENFRNIKLKGLNPNIAHILQY